MSRRYLLAGAAVATLCGLYLLAMALLVFLSGQVIQAVCIALSGACLFGITGLGVTCNSILREHADRIAVLETRLSEHERQMSPQA